MPPVLQCNIRQLLLLGHKQDWREYHNWGEPERAPHDDLAIRDGSMVHERNQHEQKRTRYMSRAHALTSQQWFHGSLLEQTRIYMTTIVSRARNRLQRERERYARRAARETAGERERRLGAREA